MDWEFLYTIPRGWAAYVRMRVRMLVHRFSKKKEKRERESELLLVLGLVVSVGN